jgi:DNA-binding transcriptional ArsR family regulator
MHKKIDIISMSGKSGDSCVRGEADVSKINTCIDLLNEASYSISALAKIMNLVGNETRLKILYLIYKEKNICVCDLSDVLNLSVSAISQQLKKLKEGGLIIDEKQGKTIYYSIKDESLESLLAVFIQISRNKSEVLI